MSKDRSIRTSPQPSTKLRRRMSIGGLSLVATTSLLGTYLGYPGLRRAYAATTCTVTNANDSGAGSLRQCLLDNTSGTIAFDPTTNGSTISLASDLPVVTLTSSLTIVGNGRTNTVIDGDTSHSAFYFTGAQPVSISGLTVQDTYSANNAAGLVTGDDATLTNVTFTGNISTGLSSGGAAYILGSADVTYSTFESNEAYGAGGALFAGDIATVTNSIFDYNQAEKGGAVYADEAITVTNSTFSNNDAVNTDGGAVNADGDVTITYSTFHDNTATGYGGAVRTYSSAHISNSTFSENTAYVGGAISGAYPHAYGAHLSISNSTLTGNEAVYNAAIYWRNNASLDFVTLTSNPSTGPSGVEGAYIAGDLRLTNSILFGNINGSGSAEDLEVGGILTASDSLFTSSTSFTAANGRMTTNLIYGDPRLGSLANNGGPTLTMMPAADSPVLAMANPAGAPAFDQRGFTRTTNGEADMGAVERRGRPPGSDPSQMPPAWFQATTRNEESAQCPANMHPSWAEWPNDNTGGWTCEWSTWWDVNKGVQGGWVTTPGFNPGRPVSE